VELPGLDAVTGTVAVIVDRSGLESSVNVERVQEPYLVALQHYTRHRHPNKPHLFAKLLMKLTDLRSISIKGECCRLSPLHTHFIQLLYARG